MSELYEAAKCAANVLNTDVHLFTDADGNEVFRTVGGAIGINVGGLVIVKVAASWHSLASGVKDREEALRIAGAAGVLPDTDVVGAAEAPTPREVMRALGVPASERCQSPTGRCDQEHRCCDLNRCAHGVDLPDGGQSNGR